MRDFFKGWKRKAGVLTLGLACVMFSGWARSHTLREVIGYDRAGEIHWAGTLQAVSWDGAIDVEFTTPFLRWPSRTEWEHTYFIATSEQTFGTHREIWSAPECRGRNLWGFGVEGEVFADTYDYVVVTIPCWSIILPLTLLSSWLLLSKPRQAKPKSEPASTTGESHA